jgi:hypothetical protein
MLYDQFNYFTTVQVKYFKKCKQNLIYTTTYTSGVNNSNRLDNSGKPKQKLVSTRGSCSLLDAVLVNVKVNYM